MPPMKNKFFVSDVYARNRLLRARRLAAGKKPGLYRSGKVFVCRGHRFGFDISDDRPIVEGCAECLKKSGKNI